MAHSWVKLRVECRRQGHGENKQKQWQVEECNRHGNTYKHHITNMEHSTGRERDGSFREIKTARGGWEGPLPKTMGREEVGEGMGSFALIIEFGIRGLLRMPGLHLGLVSSGHRAGCCLAGFGTFPLKPSSFPAKNSPGHGLPWKVQPAGLHHCSPPHWAQESCRRH